MALDVTVVVSALLRALLRRVLGWLLLGLALLALLIIVVWAWIKVPNLYPPPNPKAEVPIRAAQETARSNAVATTRASLLAALAGVGAFVTLVINYRNSKVASETLSVTSETLRINQRTHLTDRYTKAIEHLGSDTLAIKLGGIYALEQIAQDTDRPSDQRTVVDVLSAFVRAGLPAPKQIPTEVQAAIAVLARLPSRVDIPRADFRGLDLRGLDMAPLVQGALINLSGVALVGVSFRGVRLSRPDFSHADLTDADFGDAELSEANFQSAHLKNTKFDGAELLRSDFSGVREFNLQQLDEPFRDLKNGFTKRIHIRPKH